MGYTGVWSCTIATPVGMQQVMLEIVEQGGRVHGEARGAETVPLLDPRLVDGRLTWTQKVTKPMRLTIVFDVIREGDRLSGTAKPGILPRVKVEGRRLDPSAAARDAVPAPGEVSPSAPASNDRWPRLSVDTGRQGRRVPDIGMLVFPGMTLLDLIGPQTVLSGPTTTHLIGKDRGPVVTDTGVTIMPTMGFADAPAALDALFVPGGPGQVDVMADDETMAFLADRGARAGYVTSACTGSLILGAAGLLRGYRATSHWAALHLLEAFGAEPVAARVVTDRNRISGGGVTAGIDFGLVLLATLFDERVARTTQLLMEYDPAPPFAAGSPDAAGEEVTAEAVKIMGAVAAQTLAVIERRFGTGANRH